VLSLKNPLYVDSWKMDLIGVEGASRDKLLDLSDGDLSCLCGERIEITGRLSKDQIPVCVAPPGLYEGKITMKGLFKKIYAPLKLALLAALSPSSAYPGRSIESRDPSASRTHSLGKSALRAEFYIELTGKELPLELLVLTHVGADHLLHLASLQEDPKAALIGTRVITHKGDVARAALM